MWNMESENNILKLKHLIAGRFGKGLVVRQLVPIKQLDGNEDFYLNGKDLHIPIRIQSELLGTAVILNADDLSESQRKDVTEMVRFILEPTLYNTFLSLKEGNLKTKDPLERDDVWLIQEPTNHHNEENESVQNPIIFNSVNKERIQKALIIAHEVTDNWALLPLKELKLNSISKEEIAQLGQITLYIDQVDLLTSVELTAIKEYLAAPVINGPIIIGSVQNMNFLPKAWSHHLIDLDRLPLVDRKLRQSLDLLINSTLDQKLNQ